MVFWFEADTVFRYSFKILPDRLKLIRLYLCGSLGQSVSFVFGARVGHFAATPQSDVVRICAHDFQRHGDAFGTTENACFSAFITLRSQFHLHHILSELSRKSCQKTPPTLDLFFNCSQSCYSCDTIFYLWLQHTSTPFFFHELFVFYLLFENGFHFHSLAVALTLTIHMCNSIINVCRRQTNYVEFGWWRSWWRTSESWLRTVTPSVSRSLPLRPLSRGISGLWLTYMEKKKNKRGH